MSRQADPASFVSPFGRRTGDGRPFRSCRTIRPSRDTRPTRRDPQGKGLAGQPEEPLHPSRLPARHSAFYANARHSQPGASAPSGPSRRDRLGTHHARAAGRRGVNSKPPPGRAVHSVFKHLVRHGAATRNPVADVARPNINREEGSTLAFSKAQARKLLDAPAEDTLAGFRDRAILSVGLQVGLRRAEITALKVGDLHQNRGFDALRLTRKGGGRDALAINPQVATRIRAYLARGGHGAEHDAPLFRPLRGNAKPHDPAGQLDPDTIDRLVRKYAASIGPRISAGATTAT